ncbi:MAG: type II CRISPR RNA-guided endonuclease Cas9 [Alphaproteobacteria bacterium]|nr:type II CRISPR RNA-guided endonuclease Cas9 [Alphaproteobacteria bacterium]
MKKEINYHLGIDMGTSSIGWAIVEVDEDNNPQRIVDMGVRKFNGGREDKTQAPLAAKRRQKRSMRRQRDRFLRRRDKLLNKLTNLGFMPESATERRQVADCKHKQITDLGREHQTPYHLRAAALDTPLPPYALGRVLFALNQRRGFKSNRKEDKESSSKILVGINTLRQEIEDYRQAHGGTGSLGAYFASRIEDGLPVLDNRGSSEELKREGLQTERDMYEKEFKSIREAQKQSPHHKLSSDDWDLLHEIIYTQRPLKEVERGRCQIYWEKGLPRAYVADPLAQQFRAWQDINNLKIRPPGGVADRHLTDEERLLLFKKLQKTAKITLGSKLWRDLKLHPQTTCNLKEAKKDSKLHGMATDLLMSEKDLFGERWYRMTAEDKTAVIELLQKNMDDDECIQRLMDDWQLSWDTAEALAEARLESGTARFSTRALGELVGHISSTCMDKETNRYMSPTEAIEALSGTPQYHQKNDIQKNMRLPYYAEALPEIGMHHEHRTATEEKRFGIIGNPSVHIALNQLRCVINAIIDTYGLPKKVAIELAREMKLNKKQLDEVNKRSKKQKKLYERMEEACKNSGNAAGIAEKASHQDKLKYRLWEELSPDPCERKCPYTGKTISISDLFSNNVHIEHILPRSQTLDDSFPNLTLATRDANKMKGNQTPYEYFKSNNDEQGYQALLQRIETLPQNKRRRFEAEAMEYLKEEDNWLSSLLNDTRYMSKVAKKYIHLICHDVQVSPGKLTAKARRQWFSFFDKDREDHRHHAMDALAIVLLSRGMIQTAQKASAREDEEDKNGHTYKELKLPCPMDKKCLREQIKKLIDQMYVSHRVDHGVEGPLHKETALKQTPGKGKTEEEKEKACKKVHNFVKEPKKASRLIEIHHQQGDLTHTNYYEHGGVHHIDFWWVTSEGKSLVKGVAIYNHEAFLAYKTKKPFQSRPHPTAKFLMRLHKGDVIVLDKPEQIVALVKKISPSPGNVNIAYAPVNSAAKEVFPLQFTAILKYNTRKAHIDVLGKLTFSGKKL